MGDNGVQRSADAMYGGVTVIAVESEVETRLRSVPIQVEMRMGIVGKSGFGAFVQGMMANGLDLVDCGIAGEIKRWLGQCTHALCRCAGDIILLLPCLYLEPGEDDDSSTIESHQLGDVHG